MGWSSMRNSELLQLMVAEGFDALLTVDQNVDVQQNLRAAGVGVLVVVGRGNRVKARRPLVPLMLETLAGSGQANRSGSVADHFAS
jgi:hypothetical protein